MRPSFSISFRFYTCSRRRSSWLAEETAGGIGESRIFSLQGRELDSRFTRAGFAPLFSRSSNEGPRRLAWKGRSSKSETFFHQAGTVSGEETAFWRERARSRGALGCSVDRPDTRSGQFHRMIVRVAKINAPAAARPFDTSLNRNSPLDEQFFPCR